MDINNILKGNREFDAREFDTYDEFLAAHHEHYDVKKNSNDTAKEKKRFDEILEAMKDVIPK